MGLGLHARRRLRTSRRRPQLQRSSLATSSSLTGAGFGYGPAANSIQQGSSFGTGAEVNKFFDKKRRVQPRLNTRTGTLEVTNEPTQLLRFLNARWFAIYSL